MRIAADGSNYTGVLRASTLRTLHQVLGVRHFFAGTQRPSITNQQVHAARSFGWSADIYVYLDPSVDLTTQMELAAWAVEDVPEFFRRGWYGGRLWLDAEVAPPYGQSGTVWLDAAKKAALKVGFKRLGIYTRKGWWYEHTDNTKLFSTTPLWYTAWGSDPILNRAVWHEDAFGGWRMASWKQHAADVNINGQIFDLNVSR